MTDNDEFKAYRLFRAYFDGLLLSETADDRQLNADKLKNLYKLSSDEMKSQLFKLIVSWFERGHDHI
jgi:hypothetical protein